MIAVMTIAKTTPEKAKNLSKPWRTSMEDDMVMTTAMEPGPLKLGMARGLNEISCFCRASCFPSPVSLPFVRKQHPESKKADDHSAGDADAWYRNPEGNHYKVACQEECDQDSCHVYAGARNLTIPFFVAKMRTNTKKKNRRIDGIDNGQERYKRNEDPGEKINNIFHKDILS